MALKPSLQDGKGRLRLPGQPVGMAEPGRTEGRIVRVKAHGLFYPLNRCLRLPRIDQQIPQVGIRLGKIGIESQGLLCLCNRLFMLFFPPQIESTLPASVFLRRAKLFVWLFDPP